MTYEHNGDLVEWGLRFFESNPVAGSEYYSGRIQYAGYDQYSSNSLYESVDRGGVENDEIIARLLQAELSKVAEFQPSSQTVDCSPEPGYAQSWYYCQPSHSIYYGYEEGDEEITEIDRSSSCSSPGEKSHDADECSSSLELVSDCTFDEQVGRRLNQMIPIPHVPRVNGDLPTTDEATSDYERLSNRLEFCGLVELKVDGDGNCQFRALSDQLYHNPEHHKLVRQQVVNQLQSRRDVYEGYVPMDYSDYLKKTRESGAWGDHVTLQAAADSYGVKIIVVTSFKDTYYIEILPKVQKSKRVLYLSFWAEVHYNSIYPQQHQTELNMDWPALNKSSKKRWWNFASKH
uniref:ubiquitinyl hydrolase 1 n=1 Tax=Kalanchoe fedtschenkoi TaxID=63787 RepID=A0A7N1A2Z1_KALFE